MIGVKFIFGQKWRPLHTTMMFVPRTGDIIRAHHREFSVARVEYDVDELVAGNTVYVTCVEAP